MCFAVACCPLPVDHSRPPPSPPSPPSPLPAAAGPAASFAAVAVAVAVAVVGLAPPQPPPPAFLGNPRGRSPLGDPPPRRTVSPQAEPYNGFAIAPSPQPLQPPNRRGSSPSTIQMLAAGNAHNEETPAAACPFSYTEETKKLPLLPLLCRKRRKRGTPRCSLRIGEGPALKCSQQVLLAARKVPLQPLLTGRTAVGLAFLGNPRGRSPLGEPPPPRTAFPAGQTLQREPPRCSLRIGENPILSNARCHFAVAPARWPLPVDHHRHNLKPKPQTLSQKNRRLRRSEHGLALNPNPEGERGGSASAFAFASVSASAS